MRNGEREKNERALKLSAEEYSEMRQRERETAKIKKMSFGVEFVRGWIYIYIIYIYSCAYCKLQKRSCICVRVCSLRNIVCVMWVMVPWGWWLKGWNSSPGRNSLEEKRLLICDFYAAIWRLRDKKCYSVCFSMRN